MSFLPKHQQIQSHLMLANGKTMPIKHQTSISSDSFNINLKHQKHIQLLTNSKLNQKAKQQIKYHKQQEALKRGINSNN